jgi:Protein of unknown function (DUF3455)
MPLRLGAQATTRLPCMMTNMKILRRSFPIILCLLALSHTTLACSAQSPATPANLETSANQELAITLTGRGVQVYKCATATNAANKYEWTLKGPEADLFDADGRKVGRHYAGPTWELDDGSKVIGRVKTKVDAPDGKGIPWLLLDVVQAGGAKLGKVQSIQRIETVGGKAPAEPTDAKNLGKEVRVEYSATYKFYVPKS